MSVIYSAWQGLKKKKKNLAIFMLSGFFYFNSLDWFISIRRGIWLVFIISSFFSKFPYQLQTV